MPAVSTRRLPELTVTNPESNSFRLVVETLTVSVPAKAPVGSVGTGAGTTVGAANEMVDGGKAPYNVRRGPLAGRLQGGYTNSLLDFLFANLIWKF